MLHLRQGNLQVKFFEPVSEARFLMEESQVCWAVCLGTAQPEVARNSVRAHTGGLDWLSSCRRPSPCRRVALLVDPSSRSSARSWHCSSSAQHPFRTLCLKVAAPSSQCRRTLLGSPRFSSPHPHERNKGCQSIGLQRHERWLQHKYTCIICMWVRPRVVLHLQPPYADRQGSSYAESSI